MTRILAVGESGLLKLGVRRQHREVELAVRAPALARSASSASCGLFAPVMVCARLTTRSRDGDGFFADAEEAEDRGRELRERDGGLDHAVSFRMYACSLNNRRSQPSRNTAFLLSAMMRSMYSPAR